MKIATFNINSVGARIELLTQWLRTENPDVVLLQEIKTEYNAFPFFELQALGYDAKVLGQKSYNGVAVLSRHKIRVVSEGIPGFADENSRYLEVEVEDGGEAYRIASIYLPNGNPPANNPGDKSKLAYKLRWMEAFYNHARGLLLRHQPLRSRTGAKLIGLPRFICLTATLRPTIPEISPNWPTSCGGWKLFIIMRAVCSCGINR